MSDFFSTAVEFQRQILDAQKAQLAAAQKLLYAGKQVAQAQEVTQAAAEANLRAWKAWASLWGWK
ncbi:hypothetical protein SAMN06297144_1982 [Sphingomonas guangdongensis]|uniref:Phasin protein n=1 Tax=Sphingomonas guangdongensis TaxID=1141890 RepID=A0A285QYG2_9SPHN|nr:hypothetical protein [Sphingomonas guangdongensis]SOB86871.1 hypothetical protein SAMN06297144_1982 [Sphingomonas guangdongensis]